MRISDWSSDVCSSDLRRLGERQASGRTGRLPDAPGPRRRGPHDPGPQGGGAGGGNSRLPPGCAALRGPYDDGRGAGGNAGRPEAISRRGFMTDTPAAGAPPLARADYPHFRAIPTRWMANDEI